MIRLTLLGGLDLVGPDNESIHSVLQQPKRLAVLAYLALAGPGAFRRRDTALALFWPDATEEKARRALNSTLHFLRQSLGADVIVSRGPGEMGISPEALWCDAIDFDQALKRGDRSGALSLYRGDLLAGFFIDAGPEFERWLDGERNRFRRSASQAAWNLAERAEQDEQVSAAADWGRRSVELSLNDETSVQSLLRLLVRIGDRSGARQAYGAFARQLAQEYETEPSAETRQIVANLGSRSESRPIPEPARSQPDTVAEPMPQGLVAVDHTLQHSDARSNGTASSEQAEPAEASRRKSLPTINRRRSSYWLIGTAVAVCCLSIAGFFYGRTFFVHSSDALHGRASITVDQLTSLGAPAGSTNLTQALTAAIIDQLAQVQSFDVMAGPVFSAKQVASANRSPQPQLLVTGSILQSGGRVRVNVQISDAVSGKTVKTAALDHASGDLLALIDTVSLQISSLVRTAVGHEAHLRTWSAGTRSDEVYELMQEADEDRDRASQLERAGDLSAALRGLENADSTLNEVGKLAPGWGEPAVEQAGVLQQLAVSYLVPPFRDPIKVETLLRKGMLAADRAVSLDHTDASALEARGSLSYWYWLVVPLQPDSARRLLAQAEGSLRSAVAADPGHASAWSLLGGSLYARADYIGAYLAANRAYHEDAYLANSQESLSALFTNSYEIGDDSASKYWCKQISRRFERSWTSADCQLRLLGRNGGKDDGATARAWKIATEVGQPSLHDKQVAPDLQILVATVLARHGLRDSAKAVIQRAREQDPTDPELLPLEANARILLAEPDVATALLMQYFRAKPAHRIGAVRSRRFIQLSELQRDLAALKVPPATRK